MPPKNNTNRKQEWLDKLATSLKEQLLLGKTDLEVDYRSVSQSFPGASHQDSFDIPLIDWDSLNLWAKENDWKVQTLPERTHPDQKSTPRIRFTKINPQG